MDPDVIFAHEAQDLKPMQLDLVRRWGENAQYFIIAADDDQTIYSWCGAKVWSPGVRVEFQPPKAAPWRPRRDTLSLVFLVFLSASD